MPGADEFIALIESNGRRVLVAERLIDLRKLDQPNEIYVLQLPDTSTAAGGRGGGFGERHVIKAYHFRCGKGVCMKVAEFDDAENLESPRPTLPRDRVPDHPARTGRRSWSRAWPTRT